MSEFSNRRRFLERLGLLTTGTAAGLFVPWWLNSTSPATAQDAGRQNPEERLKELGLELPKTSQPLATYVPTVRVGDLLFVAGHGPLDPNGRPLVGKVGDDFDLAQGKQAARLVGLRLLAVVREALGSLDKVARVVKTLGMVNATPSFTRHPEVINGCSDLMVEIFGEAGKGTRSAVGMSSLPGGIPVEIEMLFQVRG
jgi:enamine deaminase RidA (YjgF/YER057c/UK114 family)